MAVGKYIPTLLTIVLIVTGADADTDNSGGTTPVPADAAKTGGDIGAITNFKCNPLGQMDMTVPSWVNSVTVICTAKSSGSTPATQLSPSEPSSPNTNPRNVSITNCKKEQDATLITYGGSDSQPLVPNIISSQQKSAQATLRCTTKPGENWTETVQISFHGPTLKPVSATETIGTLSIKLLKSTTDYPDASEVSLGDKYILIISGEEPYFKKVKSCKASKTNDHFKSGVEVFNETVNTLDAVTINQLKNTSKHLLSHDVFLSMTGFRLVGSTTVYLQCTVDICKSECTITKKRKKSGTPSKLRYATMKFEVKDRMLNPSSSGIKGIHSMTGSIVLLFTVTVLGYQTI